MRKSFKGVGFLVLLSAMAQCSQAQYKQIGTIPLGGDGFWDYLTVDSGAQRLYVTRGNNVMVVDTGKNKVVGTIANTPGVHGVAIAARLKRGYTSNGRENSVTVFDLTTLKELNRIPVGKNPDAILYEPITNRVFTFNGSSNDITVLDAVSDKVLGTIPAGGKPEFSVSDDKGMIYVNIEDKSEIIVIDAKSMTVKGHWPLKPGEEPTGLAFDSGRHLLFAVCGNKKMVVVDSKTGKVATTVDIGGGSDAAAFDPTNSVALSSNGQDGTLTVIKVTSKTSIKLLGTVKTMQGARTMALDPKTHKVFLITAKFEPSKPGDGQRRPKMVPNSALLLVFAPTGK